MPQLGRLGPFRLERGARVYTHDRMATWPHACPQTPLSRIPAQSVLPLSICFCTVLPTWPALDRVSWHLSMAMSPDFQAKKEPLCSVATAKAEFPARGRACRRTHRGWQSLPLCPLAPVSSSLKVASMMISTDPFPLSCQLTPSQACPPLHPSHDCGS